MPKGVLFWTIMLLWLIFGIGGAWYDGPYRRQVLTGSALLCFILFMLLGWGIYGPPLQ